MKDMSPILKDRSPLRLIKTYERGLLPTPNIRPLRHVIWVQHPVVELERFISIAKKERDFTILNDSSRCDYVPGIFLKYMTGVYGSKIARISSDSAESCKLEMQDRFSPETKEIYDMLEFYLSEAVNNARPTQDRKRHQAQEGDHRRRRAGQPGDPS